MQELQYKLFSWGEATNDGSNHQFNIGIRAKAKRSVTNQFEIANELLCMRLGLALRLPIPTGVLVKGIDDLLYYSSLHVAVAGEKLPPCTKAELEIVSRDCRLCCGILVFDSWILNEDRTNKNISYDDQTARTYIFDHGRAFYDKGGRSFLDSVRESIGVGNHCLAPHITSLAYFDEWHQRVLDIPEYFIAESVEQAAEVGLPAADIRYCTDFLLERRVVLKNIFRSSSGMFPKRDDGLLDPFAAPPYIDYFI